MSRPKPSCDELLKWFKGNPNFPDLSLGALTGTDYRALAAAVHILELYVYGDTQGLTLDCFRVVVELMQPSTRWFAYQAIAFVMDWSDRDRIWQSAGLPPLERRVSA